VVHRCIKGKGLLEGVVEMYQSKGVAGKDVEMYQSMRLRGRKVVKGREQLLS
jgi:hypothetical protein